VDGISTERHEKIYACCVEPYPDVTFTIHMHRGSLFYIVNLIAPCFLIFLVSFLGFFLPVESGDKVNLQTTILLALVVFLLMVGETMPPIPDVIPILGLCKHIIRRFLILLFCSFCAIYAGAFSLKDKLARIVTGGTVRKTLAVIHLIDLLR